MPTKSVDPVVSIIIPSRERITLLKKCLGALKAQVLTQPFEVLIGDDSRKTSFPDIGGYPFPVTIVRSEHRGAAAARMACAVRARGSLLGFLDDDAIPQEDWLEHLVAALNDAGPETAITGRIEPLQSSLLSRARQARYERRQSSALQRPDREADFFSAGNGGVWRHTFLSLGGFNASFKIMHDGAFLRSLHNSGGRCRYEPELVIQHLHVKSTGDPFISAFLSGRYRILIARAYGAPKPTLGPEVDTSLRFFLNGSGSSEPILNRVNAFLNLVHLAGATTIAASYRFSELEETVKVASPHPRKSTNP